MPNHWPKTFKPITISISGNTTSSIMICCSTFSRLNSPKWEWLTQIQCRCNSRLDRAITILEKAETPSKPTIPTNSQQSLLAAAGNRYNNLIKIWSAIVMAQAFLEVLDPREVIMACKVQSSSLFQDRLAPLKFKEPIPSNRFSRLRSRTWRKAQWRSWRETWFREHQRIERMRMINNELLSASEMNEYLNDMY